MIVSIIPHDGSGPQGKLADAELHFTEGPLEGLKLIGFTVWEGRVPSKLNVTFPARQYSVNGERRSFSLLRALSEPSAIERLRQVILDAYAEHQRMAVAS
jgi:hypothetical protein